MSYIGDFALESTFDTKFTTVTTTGAPTSLAGTPVVSAYVGNSTTQLTAGITLTVDFDAVTGLHNVRVVATAANGYATASNYQLVITTGTVGGTSVVGYVVAEFSIEARSALRPTTAARTLDVSAGGEAGLDWANIGSPTTAQNLSATNIDVDQVVASVSGAVGSVTGAVGSVAAGGITAASLAADAITAAKIADGAIDAATFAAGAINAAAIAADAITAAKVADGTIDAATFAAGAINAAAIAADAIGASELAADAVAEIADAIWDEDATGHQTQGTFGQAIGDPVADADTIWGLVNTNLDATVSSRASQTSVNTIDDFVDTEVAAILAAVDTEVAAIISTLGTPAGASLAADIAAIEAQTDDIGVAGAGLTAVPWNAAWDAEVQSEVDDALIVRRLDELLNADSDIDGAQPPTVGSVYHELMSKTTGSFTFDQTTDSLEAIADSEATPPTAAAIADAVWDEDATGHQTQGSFGQVLGDSGADADTIWGLANTNLDAAVSSRASAAALATVQTDTDDIQGRLPAALVGGRMDAHVGSMAAAVIAAATFAANAIDNTAIASGAISAGKIAGGAITSAKVAAGAIDAAAIATNAIDADALAADAVTEIQAGLATSAAIATVQADTDDLQARLPAALIGGRMDSSVGAMAAGVVTAAAVATGAVDADALATDAAEEIADAILGRNLAGGSNGGRDIRSALRVLRNRRAIAAGTLTVRQEDDVAVAWTAAVTTVAGNPITDIDPA